MWPFAKRAVDIVATIASVDHVTSPITSVRAAAFRIELFETHEMTLQEHRAIVIASVGNFVDAPEDRALGIATLGDILLLRADDGTQVSVGLRDCTIRSATGPTAPARARLPEIPPELAPLFRTPEGGGRLSFRELALSHGDRVRLRAVVSPSRGVIPTEYRSTAATIFETRDDLGDVTLDWMPP